MGWRRMGTSAGPVLIATAMLVTGVLVTGGGAVVIVLRGATVEPTTELNAATRAGELTATWSSRHWFRRRPWLREQLPCGHDDPLAVGLAGEVVVLGPVLPRKDLADQRA